LIGLNDRGVLAPGKLADVVAFAGDPSRGIGAIEKRPNAIVLGGQRIDPSRLG
jgi:imidazolonepropionase-like amidohydrolase